MFDSARQTSAPRLVHRWVATKPLAQIPLMWCDSRPRTPLVALTATAAKSSRSKPNYSLAINSGRIIPSDPPSASKAAGPDLLPLGSGLRPHVRDWFKPGSLGPSRSGAVSVGTHRLGTATRRILRRDAGHQSGQARGATDGANRCSRLGRPATESR